MAIQVVKPEREDMMKCIARFDDIKGVSDGISRYAGRGIPPDVLQRDWI